MHRLFFLSPLAHLLAVRLFATASASAYEIAAECRALRTLVVSYFHHMVLRRPVWNPLEAQADAIYNYLDVAFAVNYPYVSVAYLL